MLVIEGILPFAAPGMWRETFRKMTEMNDQQLRMVGMISMGAGLLILSFAK
jgi:hypothetical protein